MKSHTIAVALVGAVLGAGGLWYYERQKGNKLVINNAFFNHKGYTSLMKLSPHYYNITSMESVQSNPASPTSITPWVVAPDQGNAMEINAGWTAVPDSYSATVSNAWLQEEAQGAHL